MNAADAEDLRANIGRPPSRDRRKTPRHTVSGVPGTIRLRPGYEVTVLNTSRHGILIEGRVRLFPGRRVEIQADPGTPHVNVSAVIARCEISALDAGTVTYRAGLVFERPFTFDWCGDQDSALSCAAAR